MIAVLLGGCQAGTGGNTPTPRPTAPWPTPQPLPTMATINPTTTAKATTPQPTPTPVMTLPTATPTPVASVRLPGAYVNVVEAVMRNAPNGSELAARVPAGTRLGVLGISPDRAWLHVRFQPDEQQPSMDGWVSLADVIVFADMDTLPVEEIVVQEQGAAASSPMLAATVRAERLHLRAGPGVDQEIVRTLPSGTALQLLGRTAEADWVQVETEAGENGWVAARWLEIDGEPSDLPVTGVATTAVPVISGVAVSGHIVFQTRNGGAIYVAAASGASLRQVGYGFDPALSPDGSQIAFTRWDEPRGLWLMRVDGSDARRLIAANRPRSPTWTPDGSAIIFERSTGEFTCYDTPFGCKSAAELDAFFGGRDCLTTPVGTFCRRDFTLQKRSYQGLTRYNLSDGSTRDLPASRTARAPVHHPQTDEVLYLDGAGYAITHDAGDDTPRPLLRDRILGPAVYSPDGRYLYLSQRTGDHWDIWRYNSDGSQPLALTAPPALRDRPINNVAPTVSPDGRTLLFLSDRSGRWEFWLMNADGSNQRRWAPAALANISLDYNYANERMADWGP